MTLACGVLARFAQSAQGAGRIGAPTPSPMSRPRRRAPRQRAARGRAVGRPSGVGPAQPEAQAASGPDPPAPSVRSPPHRGAGRGRRRDRRSRASPPARRNAKRRVKRTEAGVHAAMTGPLAAPRIGSPLPRGRHRLSTGRPRGTPNSATIRRKRLRAHARRYLTADARAAARHRHEMMARLRPRDVLRISRSGMLRWWSSGTR